MSQDHTDLSGAAADTSATRVATTDRTDWSEADKSVARHNARLDALLELIQTMDRLGERFVGSEGKGLQLAAAMLAGAL